MKLRSKIIVIISLVLIMAVGLSTVIFMILHKERVLESRTTDVEVLGSILHDGIDSAMSRGESDSVQHMLLNMGRNPELLQLRILSPEGKILKSNDPAEIGGKSDGYTLIDMTTLRNISRLEGDSIRHIQPIPNRSQCYSCHPETITLNGMIEIRYDITRSLASLHASRRDLILSGMLTVLAVAVILALVLNVMVLTPIEVFRSTFKKVKGGNMESRVPVLTDDDLGELARSFNHMLDELGSLYQNNIRKETEMIRVKSELSHKTLLEELNTELQYKVMEAENANKAVLKLTREIKSKNVELETMVDRLKRINEIGRVLASIIDSDELLRRIIKTAAETLKADSASIYVARSAKQRSAVLFSRGMGVEMSKKESTEIDPLYEGILSEGRQVLINDSGTEGGGMTSHIGIPLRMKGRVIGGMLLAKQSDGNHRFTHDELELLDTISNQSIVALENAWLYNTVKSNYFGTIQALVNALEASDKYTSGHSERVRFMVLELARHIGLDPREMEALEHAAILHDIGKIGIDTSILNKEDELTCTEFSLIKTHPVIGDEILGPIGTLQGVRTTILQHHERYDGKGYPYAIAGDEITLKARLLSVVDTFDAMVTNRPYRDAIPFDEVIEELKLSSGTQFDPAVLNAFLELVRERENLFKEAGYRLD